MTVFISIGFVALSAGLIVGWLVQKRYGRKRVIIFGLALSLLIISALAVLGIMLDGMDG